MPAPKVDASNEALFKTIKVLVEKGDHAKRKSAEFYTAAGLHLRALKDSHSFTWAEWTRLLRKKCNLSTGRASGLMQIADGRKSLAEVRAGKAESVRKVREASSLVVKDPRLEKLFPTPLDPLAALQCAWDAAPAEVKRAFAETNIVELRDLLAQQRKRAASAAADRAVERAMPPPFAPTQASDAGPLPDFLDRSRLN